MIKFLKLGDIYLEYCEILKYYRECDITNYRISTTNTLVLNLENPLGTYKMQFGGIEVTGHILGKTDTYYVVVYTEETLISNEMDINTIISYLKRCDVNIVQPKDITWNYTLDNIDYIDTL